MKYNGTNQQCELLDNIMRVLSFVMHYYRTKVCILLKLWYYSISFLQAINHQILKNIFLSIYYNTSVYSFGSYAFDVVSSYWQW